MATEDVTLAEGREILNEVLGHDAGATEYVYAVMIADAFGTYWWCDDNDLFSVAEEAIELRDEHRSLHRKSFVVRAPIGKPGTWETFTDQD